MLDRDKMYYTEGLNCEEKMELLKFLKTQGPAWNQVDESDFNLSPPIYLFYDKKLGYWRYKDAPLIYVSDVFIRRKELANILNGAWYVILTNNILEEAKVWSKEEELTTNHILGKTYVDGNLTVSYDFVGSINERDFCFGAEISEAEFIEFILDKSERVKLFRRGRAYQTRLFHEAKSRP